MARKKNFDEVEVLDKAVNLFWEKGYNATSIQDLVEGLGINRASIYDTWGDKHQLYLSALKRYRQNSSSWLLNENFDWVSPIPQPDEGLDWVWNEELGEWTELQSL